MIVKETIKEDADKAHAVAKADGTYEKNTNPVIKEDDYNDRG